MPFVIVSDSAHLLVKMQDSRLTMECLPSMNAAISEHLHQLESVTLDMRKVDFVDSGGLVVLISMAKLLASHHKQTLRLINLDAQVERLILLCKLDDHLHLVQKPVEPINCQASS